MDLSTYIGKIAPLKDQFLFMMPPINDANDQQNRTNKLYMVPNFTELYLDHDPVRDLILAIPFVPSLDIRINSPTLNYIYSSYNSTCSFGVLNFGISDIRSRGGHNDGHKTHNQGQHP